MAHPSLSVIIPLYNASKYIAACAQSLFEQTIQDVEYLFLDDASTDDSCNVLLQVLDRYPSRRHQVQIIHHDEHLGVARIRTIGIKLAQGDYIGWCDADDWVDSRMYSALIDSARASKADIATCHYCNHYPDRVIPVCRTYCPVPIDYIQRLHHAPDTNLLLWNKIMRRSILIEHSIFPESGIDIGEDRSIMVRMFCYSNSLVTVPEHFYHHRVGHPSLVASHDKSSLYRFRQDVANTDAVCQFLESFHRQAFLLPCQYLRFLTKLGYDRLLGASWEYFDLYRQSHCFILFFRGIPFSLRVKYSIIFSTYLTFRLYHGIHQFRTPLT